MTKTPEETWLLISEKHRDSIMNSCWCAHCRKSVMIIDYEVKVERGALLLEGKCKYCRGNVFRVVD